MFVGLDCITRYDAKTEAVYDNWGNLSNSFLSLFTLVTMDRWTKFIDALTEEEVIEQLNIVCL